MGVPGAGWKSYIQLGKESTYGTAIAATHKLAALNSGLKLDAPPIEDALMSGVAWERTTAKPPRRVMGSFATHLTFDGLLELLRGVFGTYASSTVETGVRDHTFKIGPLLNGFTVQEIVGDVTAGTCFRSTGVKFDKFTLRGTAGQGVESVVGVEFGCIGQDRVSNQTPTPSLSFPPYFPVQFSSDTTNMLVVDDGSVDSAADIRLRSFEFTLENMLSDDRWFGSGTTVDEPLRRGRIRATFKLMQEFQTRTQFDNYRLNTIGSPRLVFQHPTTIGSASKREFEIRANQAILLEDPTPPVDAPDNLLIATATWKAIFDGVDGAEASPVVCRVRSTDAALA